MITINDLIEPLAEYIVEEVPYIHIDVIRGMIYLYADIADTLSDKTSLSSCIGSLEIKESYITFMPTNFTTKTVFNRFNLEDPGLFDKLFNHIKEKSESIKGMSILNPKEAI